MAVDKEALTAAAHQVDTCNNEAYQHAAEAPADIAVETKSSKLLRVMGHNLHYFTFLPLVIISILQDINLLLAAVINTSIVTLILLLSYICHRAGVVKVFPKPFDCFNLCLYGSMILLAIFAHDWLLMYVGLLTNAANATFMWSTIILPCTDNFVMHSIRDRVPPHVSRLPLMRRMALLIALTWAISLTIMTAGATIPIAVKLHPTWPHPGNIIATYVLGLGPLLLALPIQHIISHVYRKKLMKQQQAHLQAEAAAAAAAAGAGMAGASVSVDQRQEGRKEGDDAV